MNILESSQVIEITNHKSINQNLVTKFILSKF